jgi:hypothetical protein
VTTESVRERISRGRQASLEIEHREGLRAQRQRRETERTRPLIEVHPEGCPSPELTAAWEPIAQRLRENVEPHVWTTWLRWVHPHGVRGGVWVLTCPTAGCCDWVEERFGRLFEWACERPARYVICEQTTSERSRQP